MKLPVLFRNELTKQRRTLLWPAIIIIPTGATCAMLMDMVIRYKDYLYGKCLKDGMTSWRMLLLQNHNVLGWGTFMPFFIAIICAFIFNSEFSNNAWKKTMSSPVSKAAVYFSKWLVVLFFCLVMLLLNATGLFIVGKISGFPEPFDLLPYARYILLQFASILGIAALHSWLSSCVKNMMVTISAGFIGSIISYSLYFNESAIAKYFIYSFPLYAVKNGAPTDGTFSSGSFMPAIIGGLLSAVILLSAGYVEFRNRDIV